MKRMHDKKQLACEVTEEEFEELVRATPTDVRAVVDQGQVQLQLEHDSQVLGIDTDFGDTMCGGGVWGDIFPKYPTLLSVEFSSDFTTDEGTSTGYITLYGSVFASQKIPPLNDSIAEQFKSFIEGISIDGIVACTITSDDTSVFNGIVKMYGATDYILITKLDGSGYYRIAYADIVLESASCRQWNNPNVIDL